VNALAKPTVVYCLLFVVCLFLLPARQPGALSPLQGLDLGKEREHKSFQLHKHYGWLYGESKETPTKWFYRNIGKANAAVVSFVQTCGIMLKANSSDSREKATTTK